MKTICAWCHPLKPRDLWPFVPAEQEPVSHGICEMHRFALEFELLLIKHPWFTAPVKLKTVQAVRLMEGNVV